MSPIHSSFKFVDQTRKVIRKSKGTLRKRGAVPGTSRMKLRSRKPKEHSPSDMVISPLRAETEQFEQVLNDLMNFDTFGPTGTIEPLDKATDPEEAQDSAAETANQDAMTDATPNTVAAALTPKLDIRYSDISAFNNNHEFELVMHYCQTMSGFFNIKDPRWNIYGYMGNALAVKSPLLKLSLLSWSALHLSCQKRLARDTAYDYFDASKRSLLSRDIMHHEASLEMMLVTSNFLLHFDLMAGGAKHTQEILEHVWSGLKIGKVFEGHSPTRLSPFTHRALIWMLSSDVRAAMFHGNVVFADYLLPNANGRNRNIAYLETSETFDDQAVSNIFDQSLQLMPEIYGAGYPKDIAHEDDIHEVILTVMTRDIMMFAKLIILRNWLNQCGNSLEYDASTIASEIQELKEEHVKLLSYKNTEAPLVMSTLICNAMWYSMIIFLDRICHPAIRTNDKCQKAAAEIIKIAFEVNKLRNPLTPGSFSWPFPLFMAGIETTDQVYQQWIVAEFKRYCEEGWGQNMDKTSQLLSECLRQQTEAGSRVDVGDLMETTTGVFIM